MRQLQQGKSEAEANKLSVALELQADFYAGLWTNYNEKINAMFGLNVNCDYRSSDLSEGDAEDE